MSKESEQNKKPPLPPKAVPTQSVTTDSANAQNTKEMLSTNPDIVVYIGNISPHERIQLQLALAMSRSKVFSLKFLEEYALISVKLSCSENGFRSQQIVEMNKASPIIAGGEGFFGKAKDTLHL